MNNLMSEYFEDCTTFRKFGAIIKVFGEIFSYLLQ